MTGLLLPDIRFPAGRMIRAVYYLLRSRCGDQSEGAIRPQLRWVRLGPDAGPQAGRARPFRALWPVCRAGLPPGICCGAWRGHGVENNKHVMNRAADSELERFLAEHPEVRFVDAFVNDLNTIERGKRIDRDGIAGVFARGMPLPGSMYALDIEGGTVEATGLGFADGDADRPCMPIPGTLVPVPWASRRHRAGAAEHVRARWLALLRRSAPRAGASCSADSRHSV